MQPYLPQMRKISKTTPAGVRQALARFLHAFPNFDGSKITVAFMPSLRNFAGQSGKLKNGERAILFGLDRLAVYAGKHPNLSTIVFIHELFHAYHGQVNPAVFDNDKLYATLWIEGLATYVSQRLNPGTTEAAVLGVHQVASASPEQVREAARRFLSKFSSTSKAAKKKFFTIEYKGNMPPLMGYLLGYRVSRQLGQKYSLQQLAHLGGNQLKTLIHNDLIPLAGKRSQAN